jgi:hypothetical protein
MIICIELSPRTKSQLDSLLEIGQYSDYSEAIAVAIANQLVLHGGAKSNRQNVISPTLERETTSAAPEIAVNANGAKQAVTVGVPAIFAPIPENEPIKTAPFPNDSFAVGQDVPVDRWIFGQHNKLLPVKATCRALANMMLRDKASRDGLPLSKAGSEIASEAAILGGFLQFLDEKFEAHRDEALAFAFPSAGSTNEDKSRLRYANQFVASFSKQGTLTGLPVELKLVNRDHSRIPRLLLTEAGLQLAMLQNPILDGKGETSIAARFTTEEVDFFMRHIREHVPAEDFAFRTVLGAVAEGANAPESLDDALEKFVTKREDKPYTRAFLTTQRAGVVSRLIDLGLMQRVREGVNVKYEVTAKGSELAAVAVPRG